jgi:hypothetical protein
MSEEPVAPHRAFRLKMEIEADDREALCGFLHSFVTSLYLDQISTGVTGGYSAGGTYSLTIDPDMTRDRWEADLERYIAYIDSRKHPLNPYKQ